MTEEIKSTLDGLHRAFEEFKRTNDENLAKRDVVSEEKLAKLNGAIDAAELKLADLAKAIARPKIATEEDNQKAVKGAFSDGFHKFARSNSAERISLDGFVQKSLDQKGLSVNVDGSGGYLALPEFGGIFEGVAREISPVRQYANVVSISGDRYEVVSYDNSLASGWVGETASRTETTNVAFKQISIPVHEIYANAYATQKVLDDAAVNLESLILDQVSQEFAEEEGDAFINGDGVAKPRGLLTYSAWASAGVYEFDKIEQVVSGSASAFTVDGLIGLVYALKAKYRAGAAFMMSRASLSGVRKLKSAVDGQYFWQPSLQAGQPSLLLGYPVVEAEAVPDVAANALAAAFGNFNMGYQIVDRIGMRMLRDPYSSKPNIQFYATKRVGGAVKNFEAIKIQKIST